MYFRPEKGPYTDIIRKKQNTQEHIKRCLKTFENLADYLVVIVPCELDKNSVLPPTTVVGVNVLKTSVLYAY